MDKTNQSIPISLQEAECGVIFKSTHYDVIASVCGYGYYIADQAGGTLVCNKQGQALYFSRKATAISHVIQLEKSHATT